MLKILFLLSGLLFILSIIIHKLFISKIKDAMEISNFIALIVIFMALYIIFGIILALKYNLIYLIFALSPFIIGKFATYNTEKIYSIIQIICVLISIIIIFI